MVMSKKAQYILVNIMIAFMIFAVAVLFIKPIKDQVVLARDTDHLNCTSPTVTTGESMTCILSDMYLWVFFGVVVFGGIGYVLQQKGMI